MPYITADGTVADSQPFGVKTISEFFWGIINFIVLFFRTLVSPSHSKDASRDQDRRDRFRGDGPGGPPPPGGRLGRRVGRLNGGSGIAAPPMAGGG